MTRIPLIYPLFAIFVLFGNLGSALYAEEPTTYVDYNNTICPVMGRAVNKNISIVYEGKKIYFCCHGCDKKFLANPEKYLSALEEQKRSAEENDW
ncbi:MAG: YHS domain-containing protein [Waddliaceae bacterium]